LNIGALQHLRIYRNYTYNWLIFFNTMVILIIEFVEYPKNVLSLRSFHILHGSQDGSQIKPFVLFSCIAI
jgi:hypothetical protein